MIAENKDSQIHSPSGVSFSEGVYQRSVFDPLQQVSFVEAIQPEDGGSFEFEDYYMFLFVVQQEAVLLEVCVWSTWDTSSVDHLELPLIPCWCEVGGDGVKEGGPSIIMGCCHCIGETTTCEDTVGEGVEFPADGAV